jgi:hypothetical protein
MDLSQGIRRLGFRRWYERQLIESHLYLVSGILCLFTAVACLEGISLRGAGWETVMRICAMIGGSAACLWTLRRYLLMLGVAEHAAELSVCEKCTTYRGLELSATASLPEPRAEGVLAPVRVRCRHCRHEWTIE